MTSSTADRRLADAGAALASAAAAAVPGWVVRSVSTLLDAWIAAGGEVPDRTAVLDDARHAGRLAAARVESGLRELAEADVDGQRTTPLAVVRGAVGPATDVLRRAGVPPVERDAQAERLFPDDLYGLVPGSLAAVDPALAEPALAWGAAKVLAHKARHLPGRPDGPGPGSGPAQEPETA